MKRNEKEKPRKDGLRIHFIIRDTKIYIFHRKVYTNIKSIFTHYAIAELKYQPPHFQFQKQSVLQWNESRFVRQCWDGWKRYSEFLVYYDILLVVWTYIYAHIHANWKVGFCTYIKTNV